MPLIPTIPTSDFRLEMSFPGSLRNDALKAIADLPPTRSPYTAGFPVVINGENITIPYRIYNENISAMPQALTQLQQDIINCLYTRHHDGFVRQKHLNLIIHLGHDWIVPFVVQLVGEYVVEILQIIEKNIVNLDPLQYGKFLKENKNFLTLTQRRVESYWNCYYFKQSRQTYPGFKLVSFLESALTS